jgi:Ca2+-transporting ATPase
MLWEQATQTMILILVAAAVVSALLGKGIETVAIAGIVVLFVALGFFQEYRAERAIAELARMAAPVVRARRDHEVAELPSYELVPGDVVLLETGNLVPADVRLLESTNLRIQEAALTGESEPVDKLIQPLPGPGLPLGDRRNMGYMGTMVTYGRGSAVVVDTGMRTELGKIATLIQGVREENTPLQRKLDQVGKMLAIGGVIAAALVLAVGVWRGEPLVDMFLTAVSVAVAVVPEGLPAVVTITLALGAQRMLRRNTLIRRMPAVETLGSVTVICSDKTGTLTENRMTVVVVDAAGERLHLTETLRRQQPVALGEECRLPELDNAPTPIELTLIGGALCNDALLKPDLSAGCFRALGDPTEGALLVAAAQGGWFKEYLDQALPRVGEIPFDSNRKRMTTMHRPSPGGQLPPSLAPLAPLADGGMIAFTKGAVDGLLNIASGVWLQGETVPLDGDHRQRIQEANNELARNGMRVLGVAMRQLNDGALEMLGDVETDLVFIGLVGLMDPPRAAVKQAVATCRSAGIRPVMITGDHPLTAVAIARELAITDDGEVIAGDRLAGLTDAELEGAAARVSVYARVSPEEKLRIVAALQRRGQIVAMTGDGVNDAPALKKADIGVAMGITGTDVAKEAADMVLLDDNFATIVAAVEEGRVIYDNLLRFVKFSLGGNLGKVLIMLGAPLLGINVALTPLQLLWLNLLTDGLMGLGLGTEPAEADTMRRPPRSPQAPVLDGPALFHVGWVGVLVAVITLGVGGWYYTQGGTSDPTWQTMIFTVLGFTQMGHALGLRASGSPFFSIRSNPLLAAVTGLTLALQLAVIYVPFLDHFFELVELSVPSLALATGLGCLTFVVVRLERLWQHR